MRVYTYSEARQQLASLLKMAEREGEIRIRKRNGQVFSVKFVEPQTSPLDVPGIDLDLSVEDIVQAVRESRRYSDD